MNLVELIFARLKQSRRLSFGSIAESTRIALTEVEFLLMKALSLGLVRGTIDEVEQVLIIEWVQPRVLDRSQLVELQKAICVWKERVLETSRMINNLLPEATEA